MNNPLTDFDKKNPPVPQIADGTDDIMEAFRKGQEAPTVEDAVTVEEPSISVEAVKEANPSEKLITMTQSELTALIESVASKFIDKQNDMENRIEKLKVMYEKQDAENYLKHRGEFADQSIEIVQLGALSPVDNETALAQKARELHGFGNDTLLRFVNNHDTIRPLRRSQGWEPVHDEKGNEVRDVDMVLMAMPRQKYDETVGKQKKAKKNFRKKAREITREFHDNNANHKGIKTYGEIRYDD